MVTAEQVAEWQRLAEAATPGPWVAHGESGYISGNDNSAVACLFDAHEKDLPNAAADAAFIAAACNAVPALCAEVERLTAQVAELERDLAETRQELAMWENDPEGMKDY